MTQRHQASAVTLDGVQRLALWAMMASGFFVIVEPAPFDFLFVVALALSLFSGLSVSLAVAPLVLFILLYNAGGFVSALEVSNESKAAMFVVTSAYMGVMAVFIAFCVPADPLKRMAVIRNGWIFSAVIASLMGLFGYFNLAGMGAHWSEYGRAVGAFKDPNVFSTFLIAPIIFLIQGFMLRTQRWPIASCAALMLMLAALFLAFSRGAWFNVAAATALLVAITFAVTPSPRLRTRIVILAILGAAAVVALFSVLLSIDQVRELFLERSTLLKAYDAGETGRFGRQLASIPILLERPLGFGPTFFRRIFGADPHNVYLQAFASYGWLGGLTYPLLCLSTLAVGWQAMMTRTPWQHCAIACFCPLLATMLQSVQIDTDHWRHFYLLVGLTWGFYAATARYRTAPAAAREAMADGSLSPGPARPRRGLFAA